MTIDKERRVVPKLRFSRFKDDKDWKEVRLRDIAQFFKGKDLPKSALSPDGSRSCIHYGELITTYSEVINTVVSRTEFRDNLFLSEKDDVLMPTSAETPSGLAVACCLKICDVILGADVLVIRTDKQDVVGEFLARCIRRQERRVLQLVSGSTIYHLSAASLSLLKIGLPIPAEQRKIADCLRSLDDLISAEGQKLETLRQHKQGLMQQLFPRPGETVPKLRFPEFQDEPSWELLSLSTACEVNPKNKGLPDRFIYIDLESVANGVLTNRKMVSHDTAPSRAQRLLIRKDVIYQTVRPYQRNNFFYDIDDECDYVASTGYAQLRSHDCPEFLYQLIHTYSFVRSVLDRCTGSNYPAINHPVLASIKVLLPTKVEQRKIANCLNSLDALIEATTQKLAALRQHKQGLMQQLFPLPE